MEQGAYIGLALLITAISFVVGLRLGMSGGKLPPPEEINVDELMKWAAVFVKAAEMMLGDAPGKEKLQWVIERLRELDIFDDLSDEQLRPLIEAAVYSETGGEAIELDGAPRWGGEIRLIDER